MIRDRGSGGGEDDQGRGSNGGEDDQWRGEGLW